MLVHGLLLHHVAVLNHDGVMGLRGHTLLELLLCSFLLLKVQLLLGRLLLLQECSALQEPLGVASDIALGHLE